MVIRGVRRDIRTLPAREAATAALFAVELEVVVGFELVLVFDDLVVAGDEELAAGRVGDAKVLDELVPARTSTRRPRS